MKILLDTHTLIWFLEDNPKFPLYSNAQLIS